MNLDPARIRIQSYVINFEEKRKEKIILEKTILFTKISLNYRKIIVLEELFSQWSL